MAPVMAPAVAALMTPSTTATRTPLIQVDALWLAVQPIDMRAGADRLLASVVQVFGSAQAHHGYLFANARATRMKLLVHDGFGVWCAARRLRAREPFRYTVLWLVGRTSASSCGVSPSTTSPGLI